MIMFLLFIPIQGGFFCFLCFKIIGNFFREDFYVKQSIIITPTTGKYRKVTFRWFGEGNKVSVVSGFTMSKPQALKKVGDYWETTLSIAPGTYKFLYVIDGKNTLDPYAEEKDGRSVLVVE